MFLGVIGWEGQGWTEGMYVRKVWMYSIVHLTFQKQKTFGN
jgi:hypothetical protein